MVVLVDFPGRAFQTTIDDIKDLFFSRVSNYYATVSGGKVTIAGEIIGPYTMPSEMAHYGGKNEDGWIDPIARELASNTVDAASHEFPNLDGYDNDKDGYVDGLVIVHAGRGREVTKTAGDIWSHKWLLPKQVSFGKRKIKAYMTVPEDASLGVCAHELGHLLFGFPDLSGDKFAGVGNWCLMGTGAWNGPGGTGLLPAEPCAWCKLLQGWIEVTTVASEALATLPKSSAGRHAYLLRCGDDKEYFLVENRQQAGIDQAIPGAGLLVWHIDDSNDGNALPDKLQVALIQADGLQDLERRFDIPPPRGNAGDRGDAYPGRAGATALTPETQPNSNRRDGSASGVSITEISDLNGTLTARLRIT